MRTLWIPILVIFIILSACSGGSKKNTDTVDRTDEGILTHRQGHPSDPPPPCTRCNDKGNDMSASKRPKDSLDLLSLNNYVFFEGKDGSDRYHYLAHQSEIETLGLKHNDKVSFQLKSHYVLDCDTISENPDTLIYFNTGIKLLLAENIKKDTKGDFKYILKNKIKDHQNQLANASLINTGYVKVDESRNTKGFISQDYYYLGKPEDLVGSKFFMHVEKMIVARDTVIMPSDYFLDIAVDIQVDIHQKYHLHAIGSDAHVHDGG